MAGHPARNLSVRCAVNQSGRVICENSQRGSPTAMTSATGVNARLPPQCSKTCEGVMITTDALKYLPQMGLDPSRVVGCAGAQCQKSFTLANGFAVEAVVAEKLSIAFFCLAR